MQKAVMKVKYCDLKLHFYALYNIGMWLMISAKFIVKVGLTCFFIALIGTVLVFSDVVWGKYLVYPSIFIGAVTGLIGGFSLSIGKGKDDLND